MTEPSDPIEHIYPDEPEDPGIECPDCLGSKGCTEISISLIKGPAFDRSDWIPCPSCNGQGRIYR